jgi:hypothetical protein
MPGIWKLTTDSLPYEFDIRSRLDKIIVSNDNDENENNEEDPNNNDDVADVTILLKLNQDGTFRQCDEGYKEGRWVTGRWKLQLLGSSSDEEDETENYNTTTVDDDDDNDDSNHNRKEEKILLLLAMNRQYFGPPYDVLLEAATKITMNRYNKPYVEGGQTKEMPGSQNKKQNDDVELLQPLESSLKGWQGVVRKGKFIRASPGKHPLDLDGSSSTVATTGILMDPESLGNFSLEQVLGANSIDRKRRKNNVEDDSFRTTSTVDNNESEDIANFPAEDDNGGTFFFPHSSSDGGGVLQ